MSNHPLQTAIVIEDISETRHWLGRLLEEVFPGIRIDYAATLAEGLRLARTRVDLALIDIGLPDGSGIDILQQIKHQHPDCHCIVSTVFDDDEHVFSALKAGANGYLLKDQNEADITRQLTGILNGAPALSPAIARKLIGFFRIGHHDTGKINPLTTKETEILLLIAKGYTIAKTAELTGITYNTAASHVKNIYRKLDISSRAEAATEAAKMGIIPRP